MWSKFYLLIFCFCLLFIGCSNDKTKTSKGLLVTTDFVQLDTLIIQDEAQEEIVQIIPYLNATIPISVEKIAQIAGLSFSSPGQPIILSSIQSFYTPSSSISVVNPVDTVSLPDSHVSVVNPVDTVSLPDSHVSVVNPVDTVSLPDSHVSVLGNLLLESMLLSGGDMLPLIVPSQLNTHYNLTIDSINDIRSWNPVTNIIYALHSNILTNYFSKNTFELHQLDNKKPSHHLYIWAAPSVMSDQNAKDWAAKIVTYSSLPLAKFKSIEPVFAYGEAVPTENEEEFFIQSQAISNAVAKGYNTIILAYYGGVNPLSVERLIDEIHEFGAKVLFAVASKESPQGGHVDGFGVREFYDVLDTVANKIDYLLPSWRGTSPQHIELATAFTSVIVHMSLEKNPNLVVFGMSDIYQQKQVTSITEGSSAVIIVSPVTTRYVLLNVTKSGSLGAKTIYGPVCYPRMYVEQDIQKVDELSSELMKNNFSFFRLHGDGYQVKDAMTR